MSIFGRTTFSAAGYAAHRPSYPPSFFRRLLALHDGGDNGGGESARPPTLLDLGCGHGLIARALSPHFARVIGVDPSAGMVAQARFMTPSSKFSWVEFREGRAEELGFLRDGEVDMVVVGQAAHWFDLEELWEGLGRVVRPGGTLAIWGYKDNILVGQPEATRIYHEFTYGTGEVMPGMESMDRYWETPGRDHIRDALRNVRPPSAEWDVVKREVYEPDRKTCEVVGEGERDGEGEGEGAWLRKRMRLGEFEGYVRTFSAYRGWKDAHPEVKSRAQGGERGDVVDVMFDRILEAVPEWAAKGSAWRDVEVEAVWGTVLIVARRL